ncbi:uncharacterized protein LOC111643250 [Copidosoma floridanum]|uniref:uncharacterized protein LOC111643250 n=1 Tax=Copidosoma floridanum TaxID=29053 RepID=UPI000C6FCAAA|nr:uncharacterized protein LOC111643250 [Copidosoma floridanum]
MKTQAFIYCMIILSYYCCHAQNYFEQCLLESGIAKDKSEVNMNDPKLKCFDTCLFKKKGILKNGKIDVNSQFNILKKEFSGSLSTLKDYVDLCAAAANKKIDDCDVVNRMKKCISEKITLKQ